MKTKKVGIQELKEKFFESLDEKSTKKKDYEEQNN